MRDEETEQSTQDGWGNIEEKEDEGTSICKNGDEVGKGRKEDEVGAGSEDDLRCQFFLVFSFFSFSPLFWLFIEGVERETQREKCGWR